MAREQGRDLNVKEVLKRKRFFFEKKNQKTFASFPPGDVPTAQVKVTKVFCGAFLQKSDRFLAFASKGIQAWT